MRARVLEHAAVRPLHALPAQEARVLLLLGHHLGEAVLGLVRLGVQAVPLKDVLLRRARVAENLLALEALELALVLPLRDGHEGLPLLLLLQLCC